MKKFKLDGKEYSVPENFAECNAKQIADVVMYQLNVLNVALEKKDIGLKLAILHSLSGVELKTISLLTVVQLGRLLRLVHWCYDARVEGRPFYSFATNPTPALPIGEGVKPTDDETMYILPKEGFGNTSALEFSLTTMYYLAFTRPVNPNPNAVFMLAATLCRPERADLDTFRKSGDWNGDVREPYNAIVANERAEMFQTQLHRGYAIAVLNYFESMFNDFWKRYDILTGKSDEKPLYLNGEGQVTLLMEVAEIGTFGDFIQVCKQPVHTVYMFLKDKKLKADKAEIEAKLNQNYMEND